MRGDLLAQNSDVRLELSVSHTESNASELAELHSEFLKFVVQTNRRFDALEARFERVDAKFDRQDEKFDTLIALLDKRHQDLMKWLFTCWCGSVFAIVALVLAAR